MGRAWGSPSLDGDGHHHEPEALARGPDRPAAADPQQALALQRTAGNLAVARIAGLSRTSMFQTLARSCEDELADPVAPVDRFRLGAFTIGTYREASAAIQVWCVELERETQPLTDEDLDVPEGVEETRARGLELANDLLGGGAEPLDAGVACDVRAWHADFVEAANAVLAAQGEATADRAEGAVAKLRELLAELREVKPALRDLQRAQFRAEDEDGLTETANAIATVVDTALTTQTAIEEGLTLANELHVWSGSALRGPNIVDAVSKVRRVIAAVETLNRVWAGVQLVQEAIEVVRGGTTEAEEGRTGVEAAVTIASAGGTLLNASTPFTLYVNLYLGPVTSGVLSMLARLEDQVSRTRNREWIELGELDMVNWSLEPGGREMFDYLLVVMRASNAADVPAPPEDVDEYLVDHADRFGAGVGADGGEVPTEGAWFWAETDSARITRWVFRNRRDLWGMLYGNTRLPGPGLR